MSWTEERVEELKRLWETGKSASEIGKILGVSKNSVVGKAHRLKLQARPSPIRRGTTTKPKVSQPKQPPKPRVEVAPAPPPPQPQPQVRRDGKGPKCLWPIGDPGEPDFHFCEAPAVPGKPYCAEHCARAYITKTRGETRAA